MTIIRQATPSYLAPAAGGSVNIGWNFRESLGTVPDAPDNVFPDRAPNTQRDYTNGNGVTAFAGWYTASGNVPRYDDNDAGYIDPRLSGSHRDTGPAEWLVRANSGVHRLRLACGWSTIPLGVPVNFTVSIYDSAALQLGAPSPGVLLRTLTIIPDNDYLSTVWNINEVESSLPDWVSNYDASYFEVDLPDRGVDTGVSFSISRVDTPDWWTWHHMNIEEMSP